MSDRYEFQSPFARNQDNGWFNIGPVAITTTAAISGLSIIFILVLALEGNVGPINRNLILTDDALRGGEIWRIVTWPVSIILSREIFGQLLSAIFFYLIGSQFESMMGRRTYTIFIAILVVIPAILALLIGIVTDFPVGAVGLRMLFLGVACGFAAAFVHAKSFFGIPFWALVAVIFVVSVLGDLADRNWPALVMDLSSAGIGLVFTRSLGFAPEVDWIPSIALPASLTSGSSSSPSPKTTRRRTKKSRSSANLRSVTMPVASDAEIDALLDQVNEQGMNSLTKEQKATLKRHSEEMRRRRENE